MGLFSNNKKPCPICGESTPKILATKIAEATPICSDCASKISMVISRVKDLSVNGLKEHFVMREENANILANSFRPNKSIPIGWTHLNVDEANKMFTIPLVMCGNTKNAPVFKFDELTGYELQEENCVIERFNKGDTAPLCTSMIHQPDWQFDYHDHDNKQQQTISRAFQLHLYLANPCWDKIESSAGSASGNQREFQREYNNQLGKLRLVTTALINIIGVNTTRNAKQRDTDSIADDLKKFKDLLDGDIITQEEFDAKKKIILGL